MPRVHMEVSEPAQLAIELAPPEWYRHCAAARRPTWRTEAEASDQRENTAGRPLGSHVIELDLT